MTVRRRGTPLVPWRERKAYQSFAHGVFTGSGRGVGQILQRRLGRSRREIGPLLGAAGVRRDALPTRLTPDQWAGLWRAVR